MTITGLNLWRLYDFLGQHRMAWIRKSDRGFSAVTDGVPVIFGVDIKPIEREVGWAESGDPARVAA